MQSRSLLFWAGTAFLIFAACCVAVYKWSEQVSATSLVGTTVLLSVTAASMVAWPLLLARAINRHRAKIRGD